VSFHGFPLCDFFSGGGMVARDAEPHKGRRLRQAAAHFRIPRISSDPREGYL
jgi:hypothetical protein